MKRTPVTIIVLLLVAALLGTGAYFLLRDGTPPSITLTPDTQRVGPLLTFHLEVADAASGLESVLVSVRRNDQLIRIFEKKFEDRPKTFEAEFSLKDAKLPDGAFTLAVRAVDGSFAGFGHGNAATKTYDMRYDSVVPRISIQTLTPYVRRGGSTAIAFRLNKEPSRAWVSVDDFTFPAFRRENGDYVCYFAFPHTMTVKEFKPVLHVTDLSGNTVAKSVPVIALDRIFKEDTIRLSDSFINSKDDEFAQTVPDAASPLERYLKMNGEVRLANDAKLCEIGRDTSPNQLWSGTFRSLPKAANRANFAERRTYTYNGEPVDKQTHLGLDLASLAHSPVPAANHGRVVFADYLGIYGNLVVIDHGQNLQSLYSHLSEILVNVGDEVRQGDIIARTGATGLAGGDHLHFTMLLSGLPVTPIEWLDGHWIRDNITKRLNADSDAGGR